MLQPHGLYLGCHQIQMNPDVSDDNLKNFETNHSLFFQEDLYLSDISKLLKQTKAFQYPKYLQTRGRIIELIQSSLSDFNFVELVFSKEDQSNFFTVLELLKDHSGCFVLYPLSDTVPIVDFENQMKWISQISNKVPVVLEPESGFKKLFEFQQLAQNYLSEVRVIPTINFNILH